MYPRLTDLLYDIFGFELQLPIFTFGFFMATAFVLGAWLIYREFQRLEGLKLLRPVPETITVGMPPSPIEIGFNAFLGFLLGFKGAYLFSNWAGFSSNPPEFLMSAEGNWIAGLIVAGILGFLNYREKKSEQLPKPKQEELQVYPHQRVGDIIMIAAVAGVFGSKLFNIMEDIPGFLERPLGVLFSFSGLNFYGGLICATLALIWYVRKKQIPVMHFLDTAAPVMFIGHGIGRLGCHFSGDGDWGIANPHPKPFEWLPDWLWAYDYPHNVIKAGNKVVDCTSDYCQKLCADGFCYTLPEGVYPTSVYEAVIMALLFWLLMSLRTKIPVAGMLAATYLVLNGAERFLVEFMRVNTPYDFLGLGWGFTQAQYIAIGLILIGIALFVYLNGQRKKTLG